MAERLATIDRLARRLSGLVQADFVRSAPGRTAERLRARVGDTHRELFDFDLMAQLLAAPSGPTAVSASRRRRIEQAVDELRGQRFFGDDADTFVFDSLDDALAAWRERLPAVARLVRALAVADLELRGAYREAEHDGWFRSFGPDVLRPEELARFPDYLVRLDAAAVEAGSGTSLLAALAGDLPLKVVVAVDDAFGFGAQLAETAMGLADVFVVQAAASQLSVARERIRAALLHRGPALISVFTGAVRGDLPPYLVAAAAVESRAFPSFTHDPAAGPDLAQRFALHDNPQSARPWPVHELAWADEALQRVTEEVPVTPADLALCDPRQAAHLARVPTARWSDALVPLGRWMTDSEAASAGRVPVVLAVDGEGALQKVVVDERLLRTVRRRGEAWHRLRELDDLKIERVAADPGVQAPPAAASEPTAGPAAQEAANAPTPEIVPAAAETAAAVAAAGTGHTRDDAWIETPRCTTCNECTGINNRMFGYGENQQARIVDLSAGTYRELVEAAERCQVAIIHPGKPRNPNEPGLEELLERAEPFR